MRPFVFVLPHSLVFWAVFLWCFGRSLEDAMGSGKFLIFYLLCGVAAAFSQSFLTWGSRAPMVGASGAIAGVMGAYLLKFPRARIQTLVVVIVFITRVEIPAVLILGYWYSTGRWPPNWAWTPTFYAAPTGWTC